MSILRLLDIGANIGHFSLQAFICNPRSRVIALEPSPDTFDRLNATQRLNSTLSWQVFQEALVSSEGEVEFADFGASTSCRICDSAQSGTIKIRSVTLDRVASRLGAIDSIEILKMDIEGAEEAVLKCSSPIFGRVRYLIIELHDNVDTEFCMTALGNSYPHLYRVTGRGSAKPLLVGSRMPLAAEQLEAISRIDINDGGC